MKPLKTFRFTRLIIKITMTCWHKLSNFSIVPHCFNAITFQYVLKLKVWFLLLKSYGVFFHHNGMILETNNRRKTRRLLVLSCVKNVPLIICFTRFLCSVSIMLISQMMNLLVYCSMPLPFKICLPSYSI